MTTFERLYHVTCPYCLEELCALWVELDRHAAKCWAGWQPIKSAPRTGRVPIELLVPGREPQLAYSDTWWFGGFSVECKPLYWRPAAPVK